MFAGAFGGTRTRYPIWTTGVMTMKMMRSTRTTSTNGVTLMSDLIEPLPPTCMGLDLSARLLRLGDQSDVVEAHLATGLEHVEHIAVLDLTVALDRNLTIRRPLLNLLQRGFHLILPDHVGA